MRNQPSSSASAVASGRLRYPRKRFGPRTLDLADRLVVGVLDRVAVVVHEPDLDAAQRRPDVAGPALAGGAHAAFISVSVMP